MLKDLWARIVLWWQKRNVKKRAAKLDSTFKLDLADLPVADPAPPLSHEDEQDAFNKGF